MVYYSKTSGIDCQLFIGNVLTFFMRLQFREADFGDMLTVFLEAEVQELIKIFSSFISDKISDFKTDFSSYAYRLYKCQRERKELEAKV